MTKVMCFGTFDLLHQGHLNYFEQAKQYGDELVVVIARDSSIIQERSKKPMYSEEERIQAVAKAPMVTRARLGNEGDKLKIVIEEKPDIICLGYDQKIDEKMIQKRLAEHGLQPKIIRAKAYQPEKYKSSIIKTTLAQPKMQHQ